MEARAGSPGLPHHPNVGHAMVSDPGEVDSPRHSGSSHVDFHFYNSVVLPNASLSGLNPFNQSAYGLPACYLTLKEGCYHPPSKDSLPGGWLTFRDGILTRWMIRPCPVAL